MGGRGGRSRDCFWIESLLLFGGDGGILERVPICFVLDGEAGSCGGLLPPPLSYVFGLLGMDGYDPVGSWLYHYVDV